MTSVKLPRASSWWAPMTGQGAVNTCPQLRPIQQERSPRLRWYLDWDGCVAGEVVETERLLDCLSELARPVLNAKRRETVAWELARRARGFAQQFGPWSPCDGPSGHQHEALALRMRGQVYLPADIPRIIIPRHRRGRVRTDEPVETLLSSAVTANAFRSLILSVRASEEPEVSALQAMGLSRGLSPVELRGKLIKLAGDWLDSFPRDLGHRQRDPGARSSGRWSRRGCRVRALLRNCRAPEADREMQVWSCLGAG